jgi:hypothetical protein
VGLGIACFGIVALSWSARRKVLMARSSSP